MRRRKGFLTRRLATKLIELRGDETVVAFAKKAGISPSSLARLELGHQNVAIATIERLCVHLKCDVADLFPPESEQ